MTAMSMESHLQGGRGFFSRIVNMHYTAHVSPYFFLPLCAVMGVLIWHVCSLPLLPQVRNPTAISTAASPVPQPTPLATSTTSAPAASQQESIWSAAQHQFCLSTLLILKKIKKG